MKDEALGLIETVGLAAAVEAADTCLKSARVKLVGYELSKGMGLVTVKIQGDVSAVQAALNSAKASAEIVNKVYSVLLIPRPSENIDLLVNNSLTTGNSIQDAPSAEDIGEKAAWKHCIAEEPQEEPGKVEELEKNEPRHEETKQRIFSDNSKQYTCNICRDPACSRIKGAPRKLCIHYEEFEGDIK